MPFKLFLEVVMPLGGPRLATFEVHFLYRWRNQHLVHLEGGIQEVNFKAMKEVYGEAMKKLGLASVLVLAAEDKTAIIRQVSYKGSTDELFGFCG